jgi:type VI secretion system protein ImpF
MIVYSVLDRLVQDRRVDTPTSGIAPRTNLPTKEEFERYRAAVRRDLEWLLNTRRIPEPLPDGLREVERSVYYYGLPDFAQLNLSPGKVQADQEKLASMIARSVELFEPRLMNVQVFIDPRRSSDFHLHFNISARLKMKPRPEPVVYDTALDVNRGDYAVGVPGEGRG